MAIHWTAGCIACGTAIFAATLPHPASSVMIGPESRQTFEEYAETNDVSLEDVADTFSATGVLNCFGFQGTAQVTVDRSVITTVAHEFFSFDGAQCEKRSAEQLSSCEFTPSIGNPIKLKLDTLITGGCGWDSSQGDWAVVKLEGPVPSSIRPYELWDGELAAGMQLLSISAGDKNFRNGIPNIQSCAIKAVELETDFPLSTDCDTGKWSSGSAQFVKASPRPGLEGYRLAAINVAESANGKEGLAYDYDYQFNISVPIQGDFLESIRQAVRQ